MQHIEQAISALPNLTPNQRAILRTYAGHCIEGIDDIPDVGPGWIDPHDFAKIRRLAIEAGYKRRVAGLVWNTKKDKAI